MIINDPREYSRNYPKTNPLIRLALVNTNQEEIVNKISQLLEKEEDAIINIALNLAPNFNVTNIIFNCLIKAIEKEYVLNSKFFFTIPILLVVGSKRISNIKNNLNIIKIKEFFEKNNIINNSFDLSNLVFPEVFSNIKPSFLYSLSKIKNPLSKLIPENPINSTRINKESVLLRFIVGMHEGSINNEIYNKYKIEFMKLIVDDLKSPDIVLYPIPCNFTSLLEAGSYGNTMRKDIAMQVSISNIVNKLRKSKLTPRAVISTIPNAITIKINSLEISDFKEEIIWDLNKMDDFKKILELIIKLLQDMQIIIYYE